MAKVNQILITGGAGFKSLTRKTSYKGIMKILITGGAGFIGNQLIKSLPETAEIVVIDNFHIDTPHKREINQTLQANQKVTLVEANVSEVNKYQKFLKDVDTVLYMASLNSYQESNDNPLFYLQENNINLQIFLNSLKKHSPKVKKIILTSTRGVYGEGPYFCNDCKTRIYPHLAEKLVCTNCSSANLTAKKINETDQTNPTSYYGLTKKLQEDLIKMHCLQNNIALDIFRIFNVYGEDQGKYYSNIGIIPRIFAQIRDKKQMYLSGNGKLARDFVYVGDIVKILTDSIFNQTKRINLVEIYNLGSGKSFSIQDIADFFQKSGLKFKQNYLKPFNDIKYSVADNSKVAKTFDFKSFTDINNFLTKTYAK